MDNVIEIFFTVETAIKLVALEEVVGLFSVVLVPEAAVLPKKLSH